MIKALIAGLLTITGITGAYVYQDQVFGVAPNVLRPSQGGTGVGTAGPSDVGKVYKVSDDSPFTVALQDDNTGAGGSFPYTPTSWGNSTSTVIGNTLGFFANGSSTFNLLRSQHATSTNLNITGLLTFNGVTGSTWASFCTTITGGAGLCDGTDDTGGAGNTDTVLWANASTSPWTVSSLRALSSSTIAFLDSVRATSTDHFSTNATTSILSASTHIRSTGSVRVDNLTSALILTGATGVLAEYTGIDCTNQFVRDVSAAGAGTCATVTSADVDLADLTATDTTLTFSGAYDGQTARTVGINLGNANDWTALQTFDTAGLRALASSTIAFLDSTRATSTSFISTNATTTHLRINTGLSFGGVSGDAWTDFCTSITGGAGLCDGDDATGGGGSTDTVEWAEASTSPWNPLSITTLSSSTIAFLSSVFSTSTNATSSFQYVSSHLNVGGTTLLGTTTIPAPNTLLLGTATTSKQSWGGGGPESIGVQRASANNAFIYSGVTNDIEARWLVEVGGFMGWGAGGVSDQDINFFRNGAGNLTIESFANSESTETFRVNNGDSVAVFTVNTLSDYASTPQLLVNGAGGGAKLDVYGAGVTAIRAQTDASSDVAFSSFVTGDAQLRFTFTGAGTMQWGDGTSAVDTNLYRSAANVLTTDDSFTATIGVSTANATSTGSLTIPTATSPFLGAAGRIAIDTTSGNLIFSTSTAQNIVLGGATTTLYAFTIASTSPDFASGGIVPLPAHFLKQQAVGIICAVDGGTSQQVFLSDGTNDTNTVTCSTTETQYNLTSNNIWNAYEAMRLEFATKSGSPDYLHVRVVGFRTSD